MQNTWTFTKLVEQLHQLYQLWHKKPVQKAYLLAFPPIGETDNSMWDISLYIFFENEPSPFLLTTYSAWFPIVERSFEGIENAKIFDFQTDFYQRMRLWATDEVFEQNEQLTWELYDLKNAPAFHFLYTAPLKNLELIGLKNLPLEPCGLKLYFEKHNYLISCMGFDGNRIETPLFVQNQPITAFYENLGAIEYTPFLGSV
jgi:hypothetical protein